MSTDNKKILLMLFFVIDCLLLALIFKVNNKPNISLETKKTNLKNTSNQYSALNLEEIKEEIEKEEQEEIVEPVIVYDNLTYDQLVNKLNNSLNDDLAGKGDLIASKSLELGIDPYLATAIMLHETGCKWSCSYLVKACNNVGGQKGYGCGDYSSFNTLDEGIVAMITNLYYNYYAKGLTTPEAINTVYAESSSWSYNINRYIEEIRNS